MGDTRLLKFANFMLILMITAMFIPGLISNHQAMERQNICIYPDYPPPPPYSTMVAPYTGTDPDLLIPGDPALITADQITASNIQAIDHNRSLHLLIIPVGFTKEEIKGKLQNLTTQAEAIYAQYGLSLDYAYLDHSLPIPIYSKNGDTASVRDFKLIHDMRLSLIQRNIYEADTIVIYPKTTDKRSIYVDEHLLVYAIDDERDTLYPLVHETAHVLGLSDGYYRKYSASDIVFGRNTELYTNSILLSGQRQVLLEAGSIQPVRTVYNCLGLPVFSTSGELESIMYDRFSDKQMLSIITQPEIFTPLQVLTMSDAIENKK